MRSISSPNFAHLVKLVLVNTRNIAEKVVITKCFVLQWLVSQMRLVRGLRFHCQVVIDRHWSAMTNNLTSSPAETLIRSEYASCWVLISCTWSFCCFYRSQTKLREGNVFTPVCHSVYMGGLPSHNAMGLAYPPPPNRTPRNQTPPRQDTDNTTRYGQQAGGTHPTGMHTCLSEFLAGQSNLLPWFPFLSRACFALLNSQPYFQGE